MTDDTLTGNGEWKTSKKDVYTRLQRAERLIEALDTGKADVSDLSELKASIKELDGAVRQLVRVTDRLDMRSGVFGTIGGLVIMLLSAAIQYFKP